MKNLRFRMNSFPAHYSVIELDVVGSGKNAYLRMGSHRVGETPENMAGYCENTARLRHFLRHALNRLEAGKR